jgi:hypothetical protein
MSSEQQESEEEEPLDNSMTLSTILNKRELEEKKTTMLSPKRRWK